MYKMFLLAGLETELNSTRLAYIRSSRQLQGSETIHLHEEKFQESKVFPKVSVCSSPNDR